MVKPIKAKQKPIFSVVTNSSVVISPGETIPPSVVSATKEEVLESNSLDIDKGTLSPTEKDLGAKESISLIEPAPSDSMGEKVSLPNTTQIIKSSNTENIITNSLGMQFVLIHSGTFMMGSPPTEPGRNNDEIPHEVTITQSYYLQLTPVTQRQWRALMGNNPASFLNSGDDCPVDCVTWNDCQEFIRKLNLLGEGTFRLPMEAEWEYACRAGTLSAFSHGDINELFCGFDIKLAEIAWYCGNSNRSSHPVANKLANTWGLFDMHGNVYEWCQDWYAEYEADFQKDVIGPPIGEARVLRGGSWFSSAKNCRSAARFYQPPNSKSQIKFLGFRLVSCL
jgi:formylglycine-generating enzyme required for sulfatase activity